VCVFIIESASFYLKIIFFKTSYDFSHALVLFTNCIRARARHGIFFDRHVARSLFYFTSENMLSRAINVDDVSLFHRSIVRILYYLPIYKTVFLNVGFTQFYLRRWSLRALQRGGVETENIALDSGKAFFCIILLLIVLKLTYVVVRSYSARAHFRAAGFGRLLLQWGIYIHYTLHLLCSLSIYIYTYFLPLFLFFLIFTLAINYILIDAVCFMYGRRAMNVTLSRRLVWLVVCIVVVGSNPKILSFWNGEHLYSVL